MSPHLISYNFIADCDKLLDIDNTTQIINLAYSVSTYNMTWRGGS